MREQVVLVVNVNIQRSNTLPLLLLHKDPHLMDHLQLLPNNTTSLLLNVITVQLTVDVGGAMMESRIIAEILGDTLRGKIEFILGDRHTHQTGHYPSHPIILKIASFGPFS